MHWIILLLFNTQAQDNIFHLIWLKNAITRLFLFYTILSCLGYISYHLIEQCNTMWTLDHIISNLIHTCITPSRWYNTPRTEYKYHIQPSIRVADTTFYVRFDYVMVMLLSIWEWDNRYIPLLFTSVAALYVGVSTWFCSCWLCCWSLNMVSEH
jgi:hypothetical protein